MENTSPFITSLGFKKPINDNIKDQNKFLLMSFGKGFFLHKEGKKNHHIALWRAVIGQALLDATQPVSSKKNIIQQKKSAIIWLLSRSEHFETVCHASLLDPSYVERIAKEAIKSPEIWYKNAREQWRIVRKTAFGYADAHLHDLLENNSKEIANQNKKNKEKCTSKCS